MQKIILICVVLVLAGCDGEPIKVLDVGAEKERMRLEERRRAVAAGQINRETGLTSIGCKPRDLPCIQRKVTEMANESALGGIGRSASSSSAVGAEKSEEK